MTRLFVAHAICVLVAAAFPPVLGAQPTPKSPALNEPPKNDPNFELMGEFIGPITIGENKNQPLGIQIRPVGGNNFEAVSFAGGLPGQKNHQRDGVKLIGRRSGDVLVLSGEKWAIFVQKDDCQLIDQSGNKIGRLERINRTSPTLGAKPPKGALTLFDGTNIDQFTTAQMTEDGLLMQGANIKPMFQDFNLHVEFQLPYMPEADGQARGNSGVYLQNRYECQVLDSFAQDRLVNGCGAIYRFRAPDLNMCLPPLVWQTYDIQFTAPRWAADGSKIRNAHITSWVNGVKVHDDVEVPSKTGHGQPEEPLLLPTRLQDHKDPVRFRNVWVIDRGIAPLAGFPVQATSEPAKGKMEPKPATTQPVAKATSGAAEEPTPKKMEPKQSPPKKPANGPADDSKPSPAAKKMNAEAAKPKPEASKPPAKKPDANMPQSKEQTSKAQPKRPSGEPGSAAKKPAESGDTKK